MLKYLIDKIFNLFQQVLAFSLQLIASLLRKF
jgi:hypothetical protein